MNPDLILAPDRDTVIYDERDAFARYVVARVRAWGTAGRMAFLRASDPGVLQRFGAPSAVLEGQSIAFAGADGRRCAGLEAVWEIILRLPSGRGAMLEVLQAWRPPRQGEALDTMWSPMAERPGRNAQRLGPPRLDHRGRLRQIERMGN